MQNMLSKTFIASLLSLFFLTSAFADEADCKQLKNDDECKHIKIESKDGQEVIPIEESQTGDQSDSGKAVTDDPVDDEIRTDDEDNTNDPKYELKM